MATTLSDPCIILLLLSFSLFPFIIHGAKENHKHKHYTLIQKTCKIVKNIDYDFCISALQARPAKECATLLRIGWTCIDLIMNNVTDTRRHIRAVVKSGKLKHRLRLCVHDCYDLYSNAATDVGNALRHYKHKKYDDVNNSISAIIAHATVCEKLFVDESYGGCAGQTRGLSPFQARNNATILLSSMVLSVVHLLQEGKLH